MTGLSRISVRVPQGVAEWFRGLEYGEKQLVGTAALILYFNADRATQRDYRRWARDVAEGYATLEKPDKSYKPATVRKRTRRNPPRSKRRADG